MFLAAGVLLLWIDFHLAALATLLVAGAAGIEHVRTHPPPVWKPGPRTRHRDRGA